MDISLGFQIEHPQIFVTWNVSEAELKELFTGISLNNVTQGYFVAECVSLSGLSHRLGFHFYPRVGGQLAELELFGCEAKSLIASYELFQKHLEIAFGPPSLTTDGSEGFESHEWRLQEVDIVHFVQYRFGEEEYVRIKRQHGLK